MARPPNQSPQNQPGTNRPPEPSERSAPHDVPPNAWLLPLELRALWEFGAIAPASPLLSRAPRGDRHPMMVFPGLSANDLSNAKR